MKAVYAAWGVGDSWLMGTGIFSHAGLLQSRSMSNPMCIGAMRKMYEYGYDISTTRKGFFAVEVTTDTNIVSSDAFREAARVDPAIEGFVLVMHIPEEGSPSSFGFEEFLESLPEPMRVHARNNSNFVECGVKENQDDPMYRLHLN